MKTLSLCSASAATAVLALALSASGQIANTPPPPLSLDTVVSQVLSNHPALKGMLAKSQALHTRVRQARAWEDPRFGVDIERSDNTRFWSYNDTEWMVAQSFPIFGKNRVLARAALAEAAGADAELRRRQLDLSARARAAYFRLANAHAQQGLNRENTDLLDQIVELTRVKYEAGTRLQSDLLLAQTESIKSLELRRDLERELSDAESQLNVLMGRSAYDPLGQPSPNQFLDLSLSVERLQAEALAQRPELHSATNRLRAASAQQDLARKAWWPDPELRLEARQFDGSGFTEYDTGIFFTIPWVNRGKYKAAVAEARLNRESAEHELARAQAETVGLVRDQLKKIETFHHHFLLFRERLMPLARQTVQATRIAYENDKASLLDLLSAFRTARDTEATEQHHVTEYLTAVAELEAVVGTNLSQHPSSKR